MPSSVRRPPQETRPVLRCPYCEGNGITRKGTRRKKFETVQLYYCAHCRKKFTPLANRHRTYPLKVIIDAVTAYNRFYTLEGSARQVSGKYGLSVSPQNVANWLKDFREHLLFLKMRPALCRTVNRRDVFVQSRMFHGQIYHFKFHRAKLDHILEKSGGLTRFQALKNYLERVPDECPHQIFQESGKRSSSQKNTFVLDEVKIVSKTNAASRMAQFALQATPNNKLRHETLQEFMLVNDAVTVAVEIPIILTGRDIRDFETRSGFRIPLGLKADETLTGHIDFIQVRNGSVYILDYKPDARKDKPVSQLTLYALALSRLTGLRLFDFRCAWFDDKDYYEFYPLRVVKKRHSGPPFSQGRGNRKENRNSFSYSPS